MKNSKITIVCITIAVLLLAIAIFLSFVNLEVYSLYIAVTSCIVCLVGIYFAFCSQHENKDEFFQSTIKIDKSDDDEVNKNN